MAFYRYLTLAVGLFPLWVSAAVIEPRASAGVVERPIEQEYEAKPVSPEKEIPILEVEEPEEQLQLEDGETIYVKNIVFQGNTIFSSKQLGKLAAPYLNRELSMKQIRELCLLVQSKYVQDGYFLARAFPPPQEIKEDTLLIEVMEGTLGKIEVVGNKHYSSSFIRAYLEDLRGSPINYDQFLRAMLLMNENTDLHAGAVFKKGEKVGTADVIVKVKDKWPVHFFADYNNYGSRVTTRGRVGARLDYGNVLADGDTFSIAQVQGLPFDVLTFTDAIYTIPLSMSWGTSCEISYLYSAFTVPEFPELEMKGRSNIGSVSLNQPITRTRTLNTDVGVSFDYKNIKNFNLGVLNSVDKLRIFGFGGDIDYIDVWKGRTIGNAYIYWGVPDILGGSPAVNPLSSRLGAGGKFVMVNVDAKRLQQLPYDSFLYLHVAGQFTGYKLPLAQQIYIGGVDTVRGFPLAIALGDRGYCGNVELRIPPPFLRNMQVPFWKKKKWKDVLQFVGFFDQGGVRYNGAPLGQPTNVFLTGAGCGLRFYGPLHFNISWDLGFPLSDTDTTGGAINYFRVSWNI